jgi:hypothetical protein
LHKKVQSNGPINIFVDTEEESQAKLGLQRCTEYTEYSENDSLSDKNSSLLLAVTPSTLLSQNDVTSQKTKINKFS